MAESDFDVALTGFNEREIAKALADEIESEAQAKPTGPVVMAGDVWRLGHHRLHVGDEDVPGAERSITRWQDATGNTAILDETGETFVQVMAKRQPTKAIGSKPRKPRAKKTDQPESDLD